MIDLQRDLPRSHFWEIYGQCIYEDVFARRLEDILARRLENVVKTYDQNEYIGLDQDVFWRCVSIANMFALIKTSSEDEDKRRLHQDECLLGYYSRNLC